MKTIEDEPARPSDFLSDNFLSEEVALQQFDRQQFARQRRLGSGTGEAGSTPDTAPSDPFILAPGTVVGEHYEVGPIVGAGKLGIIYKARHVRLGRFVALKVIRPDIALSGVAWRHFAREARALSELHHEHIVGIHDVGTLASGLRYLVMDLLQGSPLRGLIDGGPVPPQQAVTLTLQVCSALSEAHRASIVHRDVRPENIFLARYKGTEASVKLLDFGMAIFLDDAGQCTATRRAGAAPNYLSPEQLSDPYAVDARSDLWAVGMVLYEMIAGRTPFQGLNTLQICLQIAGGTIPRIETISPELPKGLAEAIHRCLQVDPARRPASADELGRMLEPFSSRHSLELAPSADEPPLASPDLASPFLLSQPLQPR
jgi:eukaryotic-like serine/threonine-protein kinase